MLRLVLIYCFVCYSFPGFSRLRLHAKGGSPVAFVEYMDVRCATQAMAALQGSFLRYSDRGGIRIEYAKTKMAEVNGSNNSILLTTSASLNGHHSQYDHVNHVNHNLSSVTSTPPSPYPNSIFCRHVVNAA